MGGNRFNSPQESWYRHCEDSQHQCLQSPIAVWYPRCPASAPDISIYIGWRQIWNRLDYHPKKLDQDYHPMERRIKITIQRSRSRRASPTCRLLSRLSSAIHCAHTFESDEPSKQMIRMYFQRKTLNTYLFDVWRVKSLQNPSQKLRTLKFRGIYFVSKPAANELKIFSFRAVTNGKNIL